MGFALPPALVDALKYAGDQIAAVPAVNNPRAPNTGDKNYPLFTLWRNSNKSAVAPDEEGDVWILIRFDASTGTVLAIWKKIATGNTGTLLGIGVDAATAPGTNPVDPDGAGIITVTGGQIANASLANVILINSLAINTFTVQIQQAALAAATDSTKNGVAHFNSTHFTIGANAFISSQIATTAQIGIVTLASQTQSEYNTYGTTQVLQSGNIVSMFAKPPPIGSTTPNTGAFTTLIATSSSLPTGQVITTTAGTVSQDTPLQLTLRSSGTPSAGFGCTLGLYADNSVNVATDQINLSGIWDVATSGAEVSHAQIQVRSGGTQNACINFYFGRLEMAATTDRVRFGTGGVDMMSGLGSPNAVVTAAKGSFYLRTDGSSTSTRAYINTDGAMAWTAVTTAT